MSSDFITYFLFAFSITGPIFILVFLGIALKKLGILSDDFADKASKLVYMVALPALLFFSLIQTDIQEIFVGKVLFLAGFVTLLVFILASLVAPYVVRQKRDGGVFVQGAFRGNLAIIGLAFCELAYGDLGVAKASILISLLTLFYNVLSIYTLNASLSNKGASFRGILIDMIKNPLIIAICAGLLVALADIEIPEVILTSGSYLTQMTLPLALLCIGATVSLTEFRKTSSASFLAAVFKLVLTPILFVFGGFIAGLSTIDLGILFFMASTPTAAVSYVMAQGMGGNGKLAANIVAITTVLSVLSVSAGLIALRYLDIF